MYAPGIKPAPARVAREAALSCDVGLLRGNDFCDLNGLYTELGRGRALTRPAAKGDRPPIEASVVMERALPRSGGAPGLVGGGLNGGVRCYPHWNQILALIASIWPETVYTHQYKLFNPTRFSFLHACGARAARIPS